MEIFAWANRLGNWPSAIMATTVRSRDYFPRHTLTLQVHPQRITKGPTKFLENFGLECTASLLPATVYQWLPKPSFPHTFGTTNCYSPHSLIQFQDQVSKHLRDNKWLLQVRLKTLWKLKHFYLSSFWTYTVCVWCACARQNTVQIFQPLLLC